MGTTRSLSLSELRDMRKDFSRHPGEHIVTWLLRRWDNGASSLELEGKEAKQLGSLSREGGVDKAIGKGAQALSLWRRLLSAMKERYPFKEDVTYHPGKWTTMEKGIQYLRELAMLEGIYGDLDNEQLSKNPNEVPCTQSTWRSWRSQQLTVLEAKVSLTGNEWQKLPMVTGQRLHYLRRGYFKDPKGCWWAFGTAALETEETKQLTTLPGLSEKRHATIIIANAFFSIPLAAECRPQGVQSTWNQLAQGWKHSPTICHGLIQMALEWGGAPEHLQYIDDIIVWSNTAAEVFEKGKQIVQILLKARFAMKQHKVKGPAQEIHVLGIKWQDGRRQVPMDVINKITAMSPPTSKKETQAFLGFVGFWRMYIPNYSLIISPLYQVTQKKNDFKWGPEQRQAFEQIKQETVHAVALGPVWAGQDVKNVLYTAAGENGPTWSLWQKAPGETRGQPLGFWSRGYRGSQARYTPTEKEILAAYEGVRAASEVVGTEAQLLLAPRLPVLGWMFKGRVPCTHHATDATWSKRVALITQRARTGNPNCPGIWEVIMDWPEGKDF
ncbi:hypothetical protein QYF61_003814 [Mycteria americana]|uniref:ribonuclease H n=1 Tax=Mycteria americana TaxID=33587 RepID=A0AAN7NLQ6_MYCAM|nr:hypothetical protein QYF61_003814 [Mycteria americana]